jgi:hypothetical protein
MLQAVFNRSSECARAVLLGLTESQSKLGRRPTTGQEYYPKVQRKKRKNGNHFRPKVNCNLT